MADQKKDESAPKEGVVRVFLSSTFRHMQEETGALAKCAYCISSPRSRR